MRNNFCSKAPTPINQHSMNSKINSHDLSVLLDLYNKEIDTLKSKLLNGIPWEELKTTRKNITWLAITIHKSCNYIVDQTVLKKQVSDTENAVEE